MPAQKSDVQSTKTHFQFPYRFGKTRLYPCGGLKNCTPTDWKEEVHTKALGERKKE